MATYKAIKKGYDGKKVMEVGETFEFEGKPGSWMEPVCEAAKAKFAEAFPAKAAKAVKAEEAKKTKPEEPKK